MLRINDLTSIVIHLFTHSVIYSFIQHNSFAITTVHGQEENKTTGVSIVGKKQYTEETTVSLC